LCHLLREPLLLSLPVDATCLGSLLSTYAAGNSFIATAVEADTLFIDACRGERCSISLCHASLSRYD
jgi:hypothetical protein